MTGMNEIYGMVLLGFPCIWGVILLLEFYGSYAVFSGLYDMI